MRFHSNVFNASVDLRLTGVVSIYEMRLLEFCKKFELRLVVFNYFLVLGHQQYLILVLIAIGKELTTARMVVAMGYPIK